MRTRTISPEHTIFSLLKNIFSVYIGRLHIASAEIAFGKTVKALAYNLKRLPYKRV